jgi:ABC-type transporter Mla subunit MlaD
MRRFVSVLVVAGALAAAVLLTGASGDPKGKSYNIVFDNGFGLVEGGEVKVGGVTAGTSNGFHLTKSSPKKVVAEVEITEPGFDSLREDARCDVRQQSLIGEYFIDCQLGTGRPLPDGGTVPVKQTSSTIPPDLVNDVMRRPYRERFRLIISELGAGLAGRPKDLNEVIRRAHPALRETSQTFRILAHQNKIIREFIENADRVSAAVEPRKKDLSRWAKEASETASIQASEAPSVKAQWNRLPRFLGELRPTLARLEGAADEQIPLLRRLRTAAPPLRRFLTELGPFAEASRPATRALGEAALKGREAIRESRQEIRQLRALAEDAPELAKPLRQLLQTLDDRKRSVEPDPLAATTSPPAPDKTAYQNGQGFTGMEAFWNYIYWQTLAINGFDEVSHFLRITLLRSDCVAYTATPDQELFDKCARGGLGPSHPGVLGQRDPTGGGTVAAAERRERKAAKRGKRIERRRRGAGQPEAPPTPGKRDPSKPQIVIPPEVRDLLDGLRGITPNPPSVPRGGGAPDTSTLLDYLLSP